MSEDNKIHQRAEKATTYLAGFGALGLGLWAVGSVLATPIIGIPLAVVGVIGGAAYAKTENGQRFFSKLVNQLANLGNDFASHVQDDVGRLQKWWNARSERKAAEKQVAVTQLETSTFKPGTSETAFNNSAKPEVVATAAIEAPKPVIVPPAPKP